MAFFRTAIIFLCLTSTAHAEYRVYLLSIGSANGPKTGKSREVTTTLDDQQYVGYFPLKLGETIVIADSWMCWQRSDLSQDPEQKYCPKPPPRGVASQSTNSANPPPR
jgi:hypothetical protein